MAESLYERFKKFAASGTPPKDQRGKGSSGSITGKIMPPRKSVKEKKAAKRKDMFDRNTRPAGMDTSGNRYKSKKKSTSKVGDKFGATKALSFGQAFKAARKEQGAGGVFTYKGKKYTTDYAEEAKKAKTKKKVTAKKKSIKESMGITDDLSQFGGSSIYRGLNKGGMAQGYGRAAMRPGKDPRTISKT